MSEFGVIPTGFARKPLATILKEIELSHLQPDSLGPATIQTSESPLGQINGVFSEAVNDAWELGESIYQSFDPDQATGTRLESIAKLRLLQRNGQDDTDLRQRINNEGVNKFDVRDIQQALEDLGSIDYVKVFLNDEGDLNEIKPFGNLPQTIDSDLGDVVIVLSNNINSQVANLLLEYLPIGGNTAGPITIQTDSSAEVSQEFDVFSLNFIEIEELSLNLRLDNGTFEAFRPDAQQIINGFSTEWFENRLNGHDVNYYNLRRVIECIYPNIELVSFQIKQINQNQLQLNEALEIGFAEIAIINPESIQVNFS